MPNPTEDQTDSPHGKVHTTHCRVLYGDTDAAGVVYNANYLRYFEIGRSELMRDWVCSYRDIEQLGIVLPVVECYSRYKAPAVYDDMLIIETTISDVTDIRCRFDHRIMRDEKDGNPPRLLVKGHTVHVAVSGIGKITTMPPEIITKLKAVATHA